MIDLSKNQRSINTSGAHVDGGDVEALREQFEKLLSDSGSACLYEGDGQYAYPHDFSWLCYQAGHAADKAETAAPVVGRWYFVANDGAATLCVDEADARESAAEADIAFPRMAPHRAVQLVPADQLAAAVAAERGKCAGIVNELRMESARRNMPESATMLWHAEDALRAGAKEASDADKT